MLGTFFILRAQVVHTYLEILSHIFLWYFYFFFFVLHLFYNWWQGTVGQINLVIIIQKFRKLIYRELLIGKTIIAEKCLKTAFFCIFFYESKLGRESLENDPHREWPSTINALKSTCIIHDVANHWIKEAKAEYFTNELVFVMSWVLERFLPGDNACANRSLRIHSLSF
jgi:hypothetical protein